MTIFKRSRITLTRQRGKSIVLLLLMVVLGGVLSGAISMSRALVATEERLMMQVPAVATLMYDWEASSGSWTQPTGEEISAAGNLPYIRTYDFNLRTFFYSENLIWPFVDNPDSLGPRGRPFMGRGVNNPEITDIATGLIYLVEGRTFTQAEIDNDALVAVIPRDIAEVSGISIGSTIKLENVVYNFFSTGEDDAILATQMIELEVIGIIGRDVFDAIGDTELIYMPIGIAENMLVFEVQAMLEFDAERFRNVGQGVLQEEPLMESVFVLYSPRDLEDFILAASEVLPEPWKVIGLDESIFAPVVASMNIVLELAETIQWVAIVVSVIALTLILLLFLHDRRHEIGIYMALGERKKRVMSQILTEIGLIAIIGITLSLLIGNLFSTTISRHLFEQHLIEQMEIDHFDHDVIPWELALYHPGEMTIEEALSLYDVTLEARVVITFMGIGLAVASVSTIIPIWYVLKLEPKELLLEQ